MQILTRFAIVRHGETEWNVQARQTGHLDSLLTPTGVLQSEQLAQRLVSMEPDYIYSSDLGRAAATAGIIARRTGLQMRLDLRLREHHKGIFQGLTQAEAGLRFPNERAAYWENASDYVIPGGESAFQSLRRGLECLDELAVKHRGCLIVVVSHRGMLIGLFRRVFGLDLNSPLKLIQANAALNVFLHDHRGWSLQTWGDTSHLSAPVSDPPSSP